LLKRFLLDRFSKAFRLVIVGLCFNIKGTVDFYSNLWCFFLIIPIVNAKWPILNPIFIIIPRLDINIQSLLVNFLFFLFGRWNMIKRLLFNGLLIHSYCLYLVLLGFFRRWWRLNVCILNIFRFLFSKWKTNSLVLWVLSTTLLRVLLFWRWWWWRCTLYIRTKN